MWPQPLIQLNPAFETGGRIEALVQKEVLHPKCHSIFPLTLHRHQTEAIQIAQKQVDYVLTTGTGSGKSLTYIIPIVDHILKNGTGKGIQAIITYPMNALANSQYRELAKFLDSKLNTGTIPVTFERYTGQESETTRQSIQKNPPDILLTNFVMLELIMTRPDAADLIDSAKGMRFLVLDELHTYRGLQGADVALLVRRLKNRTNDHIQCVGTSATLASSGTFKEQCEEVATVASQLFGSQVHWENVIGETLTRTTQENSTDNPEFVEQLKQEIQTPDYPDGLSSNDFLNRALSSWIESTLGTQYDPKDQRIVRCATKHFRRKGGRRKAKPSDSASGRPV